jgi:hypothetical protein
MEKCLGIIRLSATLALSYLAGQRLPLHRYYASFDFAQGEGDREWRVRLPLILSEVEGRTMLAPRHHEDRHHA